MDADADLGEQVAQQGEGQADDSVRITVDGRDERPGPTVNGEATGHAQGLAGGDVGIDLLVGDGSEGDRAAGGGPEGDAGAAVGGSAVIEQPAPRVEGPRAAATGPHRPRAC